MLKNRLNVSWLGIASKSGRRLLKKSNFALPNASISFQDWAPQIVAAMDIYYGFHFIHLFTVHSRILDLFTNVNYTYFHVFLCLNILYKDRKKIININKYNKLIISVINTQPLSIKSKIFNASSLSWNT